jgi:tetratricopeptide (TPR) repeat protein
LRVHTRLAGQPRKPKFRISGPKPAEEAGKKMRRFFATGAAILAVLALAGATPGWAAPQDKPAYTPAEYNAYTACANDKAAQTRAKCMEDYFVKFPDSTLVPYGYNVQLTTYNELKNYPKTIEYADKLLALNDKIDLGTRVQAAYIRSFNFHLAFNERAADAADQARRAREAALGGVDLLGRLPQPPNMTPEQFEQQKKAPLALFHYTAGFASLQLKAYSEAIASFKNALANNPNDGVTYFRMGVAYLSMEPAQHMDGFWTLARSIALKGPGEAQVRTYLRGQLARYQLTACESELDAQLNELLTLAAGTAQRPADYKIASAADLEAARKNPEWLNALKAGGETGRVTWLAMCGLEFPEVYARVFEVTPGNDSLMLKIYTGTSNEDMEAATEPNCEVKVKDQPLVANYQKDDYFRFAGTLAGYAPNPFLLKWDNAKVNPEDLPAEAAAPGKQPTKRPAPKRPGKRPPAR